MVIVKSFVLSRVGGFAGGLRFGPRAKKGRFLRSGFRYLLYLQCLFGHFAVFAPLPTGADHPLARWAIPADENG
jgi:hypothetical protein